MAVSSLAPVECVLERVGVIRAFAPVVETATAIFVASCCPPSMGLDGAAAAGSPQAASSHLIPGTGGDSAAITADQTPYRNASEGLLVKDVRMGDRRMVVCFSPDSAARDLKLRTGAIDRMRPVLEDVNAGADAEPITGHGLYRRFVARRSDGKFHLDKAKLEREAQCDGTFVLEVSDDTMTAEAAALAYKGLLRVERSFRTLKHGVDVRPVYHRRDKRIRAHVSLCMLAYLLVTELATPARTVCCALLRTYTPFSPSPAVEPGTSRGARPCRRSASGTSRGRNAAAGDREARRQAR